VLAAFVQMVADREPLPRMTWEFRAGGSNSATVAVDLSQPAKGFRLWTATSPIRDFREAKWSGVALPSQTGTNVVVTVKTPGEGFRAYLVEAEMNSSKGLPYKLSTEVRVTPDGPPRP